MEVTIVLRFSTGDVAKILMPNYKAVTTALCGSEKEIYNVWVRSDKVYEPTRGFLVTNIKLDDNLKVKEIELTEQRFRGFNE